MPIFGSDGGLVGVVERVSGVRIVLRRDGASDADQHFIPLARVAGVTDRVTLDCPAADARPPSATFTTNGIGDRRRAIGPIVLGGVAIAAIGLLYGAASLLMRAKPAMPPAVTASASPSPTPVARVRLSRASSLPASRTPAIALARPETVAEFLNSNDPAPRPFSLDTIVFAPGSAALDSAAAKAVDGIAGVMTTHLNTRFKLAAATDGGALALRRAAAIRAALIARGVASYRIATGRARTRSHATTSGVEMIILAK